MHQIHLPSAFARVLTTLAILATTPALYAQQMVTDTVEVTLRQHVTTFQQPGSCTVLATTTGTHADPKGNGRDGDYTYFGTSRGKPGVAYEYHEVDYGIGVPRDEAGKHITYTVAYSSTVGGSCDYDVVGRVASLFAQVRQYARYTMPIGPHAFYTYSSNGLGVSFDATFEGAKSFVMTENGRQPVTRYSWDFGDGSVDDTSGSRESANPRHVYEKPDIYYPTLTVYDDKGNSDTYYDIVVLTEGVLAAEAEIGSVEGLRKGSTLAQTEFTAQQGDTLTVVGTVRNIGNAAVLNVEAHAAFSFVFDIPDSLYTAQINFPMLTEVSSAEPPVAMRASLAPGDTIQVSRRFVVEQMAEYRFNATDPYQVMPLRIKPWLFRAHGVKASGDTILAIDRCVDATPGQAPKCEDDYITIGPKITVDADDTPEMAAKFSLSEPYPNPFNPTTTLTLEVPTSIKATVTAHDALGREVAILLDGQLKAGTHTVRFEAGNLPSGVYHIRAVTPLGTQTHSVTLQR